MLFCNIYFYIQKKMITFTTGRALSGLNLYILMLIGDIVIMALRTTIVSKFCSRSIIKLGLQYKITVTNSCIIYMQTKYLFPSGKI